MRKNCRNLSKNRRFFGLCGHALSSALENLRKFALFLPKPLKKEKKRGIIK
jgi:hypothetical protein